MEVFKTKMPPLKKEAFVVTEGMLTLRSASRQALCASSGL